MADIVRSILVCSPGGTGRACQHEGGTKRREIKEGAWTTERGKEGKWSKARQATWENQNALNERILQKGTADERQSWGLMQNRLLTLLLDPWPFLSLWQEVRPSADRKHSSNLHTCGSRSYLYPIIVPRFIGASLEGERPWGVWCHFSGHAFMKRLLCNCGGVCGEW